MPVLEMLGATAEEVGNVAAEVAKKCAEVTADTFEKVTETAGEAAEHGKEISGEAVEGIKGEIKPQPVEPNEFAKTKLSDIRWMTPEQLNAKLETYAKQIQIESPMEDPEKANNLEGLTDEEKKRIKEETGWSDEIIDSIGSIEEYEIYKKAGLQEVEINGRKCLVRDDIDWDQKDAMGRTNRERAEQGLSPYNKNGKVIELHHIGQHPDSPLAELTQEEHRGKENYSVLHYKGGESEIDRNVFGEERTSHWEERAKEGSNA